MIATPYVGYLSTTTELKASRITFASRKEAHVISDPAMKRATVRKKKRERE